MRLLPSLPSGSPALRAAFVGLAILVAAMLVAAVYRSALNVGATRADARRRATLAGALAAAWMAVTGGAAAAGALHFEAPPTMLVVLFASAVLAVAVGMSPIGKSIAVGLPLAALVGYQGYRVIVELLLHRAYSEGLIPVQMTYSGRNFDIVTGILALALGAWLATGRRSLALVAAWNTLGLALLLNIVSIVVLSAPTPFRRYMNEPSSAWITHAPWVWLPTVLAAGALFGHVVVYRRLALEYRERA